MDNVNDIIPKYQPLNTPDGIPTAPIPLEPFPQTEEVDVHWIHDAIIEEIEKIENYFYVTVTFQEKDHNVAGPIQSIILIVSQQITRLFDEERRIILPENLEVGMLIDALISSRMTMSLPPQALAFQIIVVAAPLSRMITVGDIVQVNIRNNFLLIDPIDNPGNILRINITEETVILNPKGRQMVLQDLYPGMMVRVEHAQFMTASIPPQTPGYIIQVIE